MKLVDRVKFYQTVQVGVQELTNLSTIPNQVVSGGRKIEGLKLEYSKEEALIQVSTDKETILVPLTNVQWFKLAKEKSVKTK